MNSLPARGKELTIVVPADAFESFMADASWSAYTILSDGQTGVSTVATVATDTPVYNLHGQRVGSISTLRELPAGLYIVNGRKVMK